MENHVPQVLLMGNGVNQAFGGQSWDDLLQTFANENSGIDISKLTCPAPLKAILATGDNISHTIGTHTDDLYGEIETEEQRKILKELLSLRFDHVLTSNYSYELECAALGINSIDDRQLKKIMAHTSGTKTAEAKYLLHTYSGVDDAKIWHIHGEARKPNSIILGHYYYGNLLFKIKEYCDKKGNSLYYDQQYGQEAHINSWIDAFLLGDVYVLGFGFNLAEFDLWWLLNRRKNEKAEKGKFFYYTPEPTGYNEKYELLKLMGAEMISCNYKKDSKDWDQYKDFYTAAISDIKGKMNKNREVKNHG